MVAKFPIKGGVSKVSSKLPAGTVANVRRADGTYKSFPLREGPITPSAEELVNGPAGVNGNISSGSSAVISPEENAALLEQMGLGQASGVPGGVLEEGATVVETAANTAKAGAVVDDAGLLGLLPEGPLNGVAMAAGIGPGVLGGSVPVIAATAKKLGKEPLAHKLENWQKHWNPQVAPPMEEALGNAGKIGFLKKIKNHLNPSAAQREVTRLDHIGNIGFAAGGALSTYGVAKSFAQQLNSLKYAIADVKGVSVGSVSTMGALFGPIPKSLEPARNHLLNEHAVRGVIQAAGLATMIWSVRNRKHLNMFAFMAPGILDMGANTILGESMLPVYAGYKNAFNSGQPLPPEAYAEFLLASSAELKKRGEVGKLVAQKLGVQYATAKTDPGKILQEMDNGKFDGRIQGLITIAEKEDAEQMAQAKAKQAEDAHAKAEANAHPSDTKHNAASGSMVSRVRGEKPKREGIGDFTNKLGNESAVSQGITQ